MRAVSRLVIGLAAVVAASVLPAHVQAQTPWPAKPIRFVIPYQPGGIVDAAARIVGAKLTEAWGQQIIVENKPGGSGFIGMGHVAKSAPDGYTYVLATLGDFTVNQWLFADMPYDIERDLIPVAMLSTTPCMIAVNADAPYKSIADLIADAKARPGKVAFASSGNGSINHIATEAFALNAGIKLQHIPYKGGAPSALAVAAGDLPMGNLAVTGALPHIRNGKIRVLALTSMTRPGLAKDWPTLAEIDPKLLEFDGSNWTGMMAPKGTPAEIIGKLNGEINKVLAMADVKERLLAGGSEPLPLSVDAFAARLKAERASFKVVVEKANIKPE